jgi:hypothetical protein
MVEFARETPAVGDFVAQTSVELTAEADGVRHYGAELAKEWMTWGPAGGYVAAVALRAAGEATSLARPASFSCQYLSVARFDSADLEVTTLRAVAPKRCACR